MLSMVMGPTLILNSTLAPLPGLPWYFFAADHRLAVGDVDVMGAVVTYQYGVLFKVHGVEFSKAATDIQAVHDQHGHAGFEIVFTAHGEARASEQAVAHYEVGYDGT